MTIPSTKPSSIEFQRIINAVGNIQRVTVKAFNALNLKNLIFIILNDTYQVLKYDRAILFSTIGKKSFIRGISGQATFNLQTEMSARLLESIEKLNDRSTQRILGPDDFSSNPQNWAYIQAIRATTIYWVPFTVGDENLGLWLERYEDPEAKMDFETHAGIIKEFLIPGYKAAWEKKRWRFSWKRFASHFNMKKTGLYGLGLLVLMFLIPVRLQIVAPCEVVAKDPYIVTAPMTGIIDHVNVYPGQEILKDQVLFEYDKKYPTYQYQAALKDVEYLRAILNHSYVLGTSDSTETSKLTQLNLKLKSGEATLELAKRQFDYINNKSPMSGLVSIQDPDEWRGKPVKMGEKLMSISNPNLSKLRIWIPESGHIEIDKDVPVHAFFSPIPEITFTAKIFYLTPEVKINEAFTPSLEAEAEWLNVETPPQLGLKGYAIVYGERVSLFYYLMHKPIAIIQKLLR
jgi:hypothetical protein